MCGASVLALDIPTALDRYDARGFVETINVGLVEGADPEAVRDALDAPGEFHLDRSSGVLTYYPRPGEDMTSVEAIAPVADDLLRLESDPATGSFVQHLRFEGLSFQHAAWRLKKTGFSP